MDTSRTPFLVVGAGISGLAAARAVQDCGFGVTVLEAGPTVGGLTRSITVGEFSFDYTGHLLHLARTERPSQVPFAGLVDEEWMQVSRDSRCLLGGQLVEAPVQYNLGALPEEMRKRCMDSYYKRPPLPEGRAASFREFLVSGFGQELAEVFLIPQNEKTQATDLSRLSTTAIKRFFPAPDDTKVRNGMVPGAVLPAEYNSRFWYPKIGGIEALVQGLARELQQVQRLQSAIHLDLEHRVLTTTSGRHFQFDQMWSALPLKRLCEITGDPDLLDASRELTHSATLVFNLGVEGELHPSLAGAQWIYVPDREIPFYRVGVYSHISEGMCPPGCHALYVEVGVPGEDADRTDLVAELQPKVLAALELLGWLHTQDIRVCAANVMRCAYVHHTPGREQVIGPILERLASHGVHPVGRYGLWDYISMEDSIYSGIESVRRVLQAG